MIASSHVLTPEGYKDARSLKEGDVVYSWTSGRWFANTVKKIEVSQTGTIYSIHVFDGKHHMVLRCEPQQEFRHGRHRRTKAHKLKVGDLVLCSDECSAYKVAIGLIEEAPADEPTIRLKLMYPYSNVCAEGFIVAAK